VRKFGMKDVTFERVETAWNLAKRYWFHFLSLISIVLFILWGYSPVLSVFWATVVSALTSFLRPDTALISWDVFKGREPRGRGGGDDPARRTGRRSAHVHLLLRGALGGVAADSALYARGCRDHRRRSVQDDAPVLEVHDAGLSRAVHVCPRPERHGVIAHRV